MVIGCHCLFLIGFMETNESEAEENPNTSKEYNYFRAAPPAMEPSTPKESKLMATVLRIKIKPDQELVNVYVFCFKDSIPTILSIFMYLLQFIFLTYS